jgi:hypothetical protein
MNPPTAAPKPPATLSDLDRLPLESLSQQIWESAMKSCGGPAALRHRIGAEARDLLGLAQLSERLQVHWLDLSVGLRAKVELEVPVPCLPDPAGALEIASRAVLGLIYPPEAVLLPLPGYAFVRILQPRFVWHPNVSPDVNQALCLGTRLPAAIPLREIVLMTFGALSMQTTQLDILDPAGVLSAASAEWWQRNPRLIPLSRESFLRKEAPHVA